MNPNIYLLMSSMTPLDFKHKFATDNAYVVDDHFKNVGALTDSNDFNVDNLMN